MVRKREHKDNKITKNLRFALLKNPDNQTDTQKALISALLEENSDTIQAYQMRLNLKDIYDVSTRETAPHNLKAWVSVAIQSNIPEMIKVGETIKEYKHEILNYFTSRMTNGVVEGINTIIQLIKRRARGFANLDHFMTMVFLRCGKLDFRMEGVMAYPR